MYKVSSKEDLKRVAPSIFTEHASLDRSDAYQFVPTFRLVDTLAEGGWFPVRALQQRTAGEGSVLRQPYVKHLIRFQQQTGTAQALQELRPEIVLTNSHNGLSSFQLSFGLYRLVCSNGLTVSEGDFGTIRIRHMGYTNQQVYDAMQTVQTKAPEILDAAKRFQSIELTQDEKGIFALAAAVAKYEVEKEALPFNAEMLLNPRRSADTRSDLFTTMNVIQENLVKGRQRFRRRVEQNGYPRIQTKHTRGISSINEDLRVNKALWTLTSEMAKLKVA